VIPDMLAVADVAEMNAAVDRCAGQHITQSRHSNGSNALAGTHKRGRGDIIRGRCTLSSLSFCLTPLYFFLIRNPYE
jgi:hypothetical protein